MPAHLELVYVQPADAVADARRPTRILVVLPAFNEEANIGPLLDRIDGAMVESHLSYEVLVVDDGSRDHTFEVLCGCAGRLPVTVARHAVNEGLGSTIGDGLELAAGMAQGGDIIVTMDADESHTPGLIGRMVQAIQEGHDVVIASRYRPGARTYGLSWQRTLVSYAASWLFRILFPTRGVRDYTCGYRAYRAVVLQEALAAYQGRFFTLSGFQSMVDILLKLRRFPIIFGEVPMILRYDLKKGSSKMKVARTAGQTLALIWKRRMGDYS